MAVFHPHPKHQRLVAHHQLLQIADLLQVPCLLAVKIRCRSRRTSSSTRRHSTASQSRTSSSGPFTTTPSAAVSNLPIGSGVSDHRFVTGSPDPRQRPFGPGHTPVSDQLCGHPPAEVPVSRFPVSCCLSAIGIRFLGHPAPAAEFSLPHGRPTDEHTVGPQRGCRVAHEQDPTGQGASLTPGTVVRSRPAIGLRPAPAAFQRPVPTTPLTHPIGGANFHEASTEIHLRSPITPGQPAAAPGPGSLTLFPPVFSSPVAPGWNRDPSASTPGFAPRGYPRARRGGDRPSRTGPGTTPSTSAEPPTGASHSAHAPSRRTQPYVASSTTSGASPARAITARRYSGSLEIRTVSNAPRPRSSAPAPTAADADPSRRTACPRSSAHRGLLESLDVSTPSMSRGSRGAEAPLLHRIRLSTRCATSVRITPVTC